LSIAIIAISIAILFSIAAGIAILVPCLVLHVVLQYFWGLNIAILGSNNFD